MPADVTLGPPVMVSPLVFTSVLPIVTLPVAPRLISFASFTVSVSVPSATTPMFPSVSVPAAPPTMLTVSPSLRSTSVPLSPAKVSGLLALSATTANCSCVAAYPPV